MGNKESRDYEAGDVLYRDLKQFGMANHYGVYIGFDLVIDSSKEGIKLKSLKDFKSGYKVHVKRGWRTLPRDMIVVIATYLLNNKEKWGEYSLVFNNCEHFACFCATGVGRSGQVEKVVIGVETSVHISYSAVIGIIGIIALILL